MSSQIEDEIQNKYQQAMDCLSQYEYENAIVHLKKVTSMLRDANSGNHIETKRSEGFCLSNIGDAYRNLGQNENAIYYYQQGLNIACEIKDQKRKGNRLNNIGLAYI